MWVVLFCPSCFGLKVPADVEAAVKAAVTDTVLAAAASVEAAPSRGLAQVRDHDFFKDPHVSSIQCPKTFTPSHLFIRVLFSLFLFVFSPLNVPHCCGSKGHSVLNNLRQ
jgi:hypothetical protein